MKPYSVIERKETYHGKIINVVQDTIILPDGRSAIREMVLHGGASAILPVDRDGNIIFVRQYRHPVGELVLEIPAGTLEKNEDPLLCASRELEEETGFKAGKFTLVTAMYSSIGFCTELLYIYIAENLSEGTMNLDEDEFVTVEKYSLEQAVDMIFKNEIKDSKTISAVLAYKAIIEKAN